AGAEAFVEDLHRSGGRVQIGGGELHHRGLARAVGAENDPTLAIGHGPDHRIEDVLIATAHRDVVEVEDVTHGSTLTEPAGGDYRGARCECAQSRGKPSEHTPINLYRPLRDRLPGEALLGARAPGRTHPGGGLGVREHAGEPGGEIGNELVRV